MVIFLSFYVIEGGQDPKTLKKIQNLQRPSTEVTLGKTVTTLSLIMKLRPYYNGLLVAVLRKPENLGRGENVYGTVRSLPEGPRSCLQLSCLSLTRVLWGWVSGLR